MPMIRAKTKEIKRLYDFSCEQNHNMELNDQESDSATIKLESYPKRIVCEMTSACNIHCKMCGRIAADFKPTFFDIEWLNLFENASKYIGELTLLGWGEPTLHPRFSDFLKWAYEHKMQKFFCTNGTRLDAIIDDIFDYHTELLTVSLDGAEASTNNEIRKGADFEKITSNISWIVKEKQRRGVNYPHLSIVMTMMESNYRQLPDFVKLAADLGIQEAKGVYLTVFDDKMLSENMYGKQSELKEIFAKAEKVAVDNNILLKLPYIQGEDIASGDNHKKCFVGWRDFFLGSDGYVRPCMSTSKKLFHVSKYKSFEEMWNSEEYQEFRSRVNNENMDIPCKNCYQASFANWNRRSSFIQIGNNFAPEWD